MKPPYKKTQFGLTSVIAAGVAVAYIFFMALITDEPRTWALATAAALLLVMVPLTSMTIQVTPSAVEWWFSLGIARQRLATSEIRGARVIRTNFLSGFGVHSSGTSTLWAVSGYKAVALDLTDEKVIALSTNEPQVVADAINRLIVIGGGAIKA